MFSTSRLVITIQIYALLQQFRHLANHLVVDVTVAGEGAGVFDVTGDLGLNENLLVMKYREPLRGVHYN